MTGCRFELRAQLCTLVFAAVGCSKLENDSPVDPGYAALALDVSHCPSGYNIIQGTNQSETLTGTSGNDCIVAKGGTDTVFGRGGNDFIIGAMACRGNRGQGSCGTLPPAFEW